MQKRIMLMVSILATIILCSGVSLAQDERPGTGTFIKSSEMNGICRLDIINNGYDDAVVYLSSMQKEIMVAVYIQGGDFFNLTGIDDGNYELYIKQGQKWNSRTGKFEINATSSRMEEPLTFETQKTPQGIRYSWGQVTLDEVPHGNIKKISVNEEDFPILK